MTDLSRSAEDLARIAVELASRVRDVDPEANGRWLAAVLPEPSDWFRLAFVLAAAIPDDRSWRQLTSWTLMTANHRTEEAA
jgi:hypothetical protein